MGDRFYRVTVVDQARLIELMQFCDNMQEQFPGIREELGDIWKVLASVWKGNDHHVH